MARDFANTPKEPERSHVPRWVWLFTTVCAIGFVAFLYFLSQVPEEQGGIEAVREQLSNAISETTNVAPPPKEEPERNTLTDLKEKAEVLKQAFEFYELLENDEVSINLPGNEPETQTSTNPTGTAAVPEASNWIIQVASFRRVSDADKVRAELILNGLPSAIIQSVEVKGQGTYHRVVVGPFDHRPTLNKAQDILAGLNYEVLVKKL